MPQPGSKKSPRRTRRTACLAVGVAGALVVTACSSGGQSAANNTETAGSGARASTYTVGVVVPLSGVYGTLGKSTVDGLQTYLDTHGNKFGSHPVEIKTVDAKADPQTATSVTRTLISTDHVDAVVGVVSSAVALAMKPIIEAAKIPFIITTAGADALTCETSPYIWRTSFANSQNGAAMAKYLAGKYKGSKIATIAPDYAAGTEHLSGFKQALEAAGGKVSIALTPPFGTTKDYQPYISKLAANKPAAVWAMFAGAESVQFVKQYSQFGLNKTAQLYGNTSLVDPTTIDAEGDAALGVETSQFYVAGLKNQMNTEFVEAYKKAYGGEPSFYAEAAYDAGIVLAEALQKVGTEQPTGQAVADALSKIGTISTPRGDWEFDSHHNPYDTYYRVKAEKTPNGYENVVQDEIGRIKQSCS